MSEVIVKGRATKHRPGRLVATAACLAVSTALACASKPMTHITEVPIDQFQGANGPALVTGDPGGAPTEPAPEAAGVTVAATAGSASPTPLPTTPGAAAGATASPTPSVAALPPFPSPGTHPKPARAARLAAADCGRLADRYFLVVGMSQGLTVAQATKAAPGVKAQVVGDPTYAADLDACAAQNTRKQYACAMKTTTADAWKACLE